MGSTGILRNRRSATGTVLQPASRPPTTGQLKRAIPSYSLLVWTLGRGSVVSATLMIHLSVFTCEACRYGEYGQQYCFIPPSLQVV